MKKNSQSAHTRRAWRCLERWGLLLVQDATLPGVATLVSGGPIRGSWWGHPQGRAIFHAIAEIEDHPDVLTAKLVSGKVTLVHRRYWPALAAVGGAREPWQLLGLSRDARRLLDRVEQEPSVRASGQSAKSLEQALLVASRQVHTETGAHALELMSWRTFAREEKLRSMPAERARADLESALDALNREYGGRATLPWSPRS